MGIAFCVWVGSKDEIRNTRKNLIISLTDGQLRKPLRFPLTALAVEAVFQFAGFLAFGLEAFLLSKADGFALAVFLTFLRLCDLLPFLAEVL